MLHSAVICPVRSASTPCPRKAATCRHPSRRQSVSRGSPQALAAPFVHGLSRSFRLHGDREDLAMVIDSDSASPIAARQPVSTSCQIVLKPRLVVRACPCIPRRSFDAARSGRTTLFPGFHDNVRGGCTPQNWVIVRALTAPLACARGWIGELDATVEVCAAVAARRLERCANRQSPTDAAFGHGAADRCRDLRLDAAWPARA